MMQAAESTLTRWLATASQSVSVYRLATCGALPRLVLVPPQRFLSRVCARVVHSPLQRILQRIYRYFAGKNQAAEVSRIYAYSHLVYREHSVMLVASYLSQSAS